MDWQPIETAPKLKYVLVYVHGGVQDVFIAAYKSKRSGTYLKNAWFPLSGGSTAIFPTHWMPLPSAPTQDKEK